MNKKIIIATRESHLALWQAEHVKARLMALHPGLEVELLGMTTQGDQILDSPLSRIGGKGLFVKELEVAMAEGRADLAVHSIKDVPMDLPEGFELTAISQREDPRDAIVSNKYARLADLPDGARVGTSSLRRQAQLRAHYPHLVIDTLRGNVNTRLRKLDEGQYDAIILAAAGLKRLGFQDRIRAEIPPEESLPAVGQGALGIEIRSGRPDIAALLAPLNDPETAACVRAIGGFAQIRDGQIHLRSFVADLEGIRFYRSETSGAMENPEAVGLAAAEDLISQGADTLLAEIVHRNP